MNNQLTKISPQLLNNTVKSLFKAPIIEACPFAKVSCRNTVQATHESLAKELEVCVDCITRHLIKESEIKQDWWSENEKAR